jgi:hypothetical protein
MSRTAYVTLEDGASYQPVTDYIAVLETDVTPWYSGDTYRDLFGIPSVTASAVNSGAATGVWFPAADGQVFDASFGASNQVRAHLSDDLTHTAPRDAKQRQTRLRFYAGLEYVFTADAAADVLILPAGMELSIDDVLSVTTDNALPGGLAANTLYYVISASARRIKVSTTMGGAAVNISSAGTGTHTAFARVLIADFKPTTWTCWSNTKPQRF